MSAWSWDRRLATDVIKNIISRGRVNMARRRNRELAAAGTPVRRGRPPRTREARAPAPVQMERPQALSGSEINRLYSNAAVTKRRRLLPQ